MRLILCAAAALLAGCAGIPPQELQASAEKTVIASSVSPAATYRRIATASRACYERSFEVASDYYPDTQTGRVSASIRSPFALSALYVAEVAPAPGGASVAVALHPSAGRFGRKVLGDFRLWVDDVPHCAD